MKKPTLLTLGLCGLLLSLSACRNKETMAPIVLGGNPGQTEFDGDEQFGPTWRKSAITLLPNQTQLVWLAERDRQRMDIRLMIPLPGPQEQEISAAALEIVLSVLEKQLRFRAHTAQLRFSRNDRPGRTEFAFHGRVDQLRHALFLIGHGFSATANKSLLSESQGEFVAAWVDNPVDHATRDQIATLLDIKPASLYASSRDLAALTPKTMAQAWKALTNPARCTLVVHSHVPTQEDQRSLSALAQRWSRSKKTETKAIDALFTPSKPLPKLPHAQQSLRQTPIESVPSPLLSPTGRVTWLVSRRFKVPDTQSRAFARLAQRLLQHQFDVRLVIHNQSALWQLRKDLSPEPKLAAEEMRRYLGDLDRALHEGLVPSRARQAARTWLGARLVQNSLQGEDWTALWSQALDLSSKPSEIHSALQENGTAMMQAEIKAFEQWMQAHIDPSLARGPWLSELIFASPETVQALNEARTQAPPE